MFIMICLACLKLVFYNAVLRCCYWLVSMNWLCICSWVNVTWVCVMVCLSVCSIVMWGVILSQTANGITCAFLEQCLIN